MGREVFVSYKFSDAVKTRDELRKKLGKDGQYYNGEKGYVALDVANDTIKNYLKEMIYHTSVTIVIISPQVRYSDWVDWEVRYSLRQTSKDGRTSHRNGIVCVIQECKDWLGNDNIKWALDNNMQYKKEIFPKAIIDNLRATFPPPQTYEEYIKNTRKSYKDYCVVVGESTFKSSPSTYIEAAYKRANDENYEVIVNKRVF